MRFFPLFLFLFFITPDSLEAQASAIQIQEELGLITRKVDSLSFLIASGSAKSFKSPCSVPGHKEYFLQKDNVYLSESALHLKEEEKEPYCRMYALGITATALYMKKQYAASTTNWQEALAISSRLQFIHSPGKRGLYFK